jgi:NDP-sugar pyrophosphorylase family protein
MLLCAGKGTRLGDLSDEKPKPLLPVCDIAILRYGITNLVARGVSKIVINLHHRGELIREELGDGSSMGASIQYSEEDEILGTGGGLKKALHLLDPEGKDEPFLSMNGKLIFDLDIQALLASHAAQEDSLGTMVVKPAPNAMKWGALDVRPEGQALRIHNILESGAHMFCGVHVTRPSVVRNLPEGEACMIRQGYLPWLKGGQRVSAFVHEGGYFAEHSTPKRYLQSSIDLLSGIALTNPPGTLQGVDASAEIHENATIVPPVRIGAGAVIESEASVGPNVVVGRGAHVASGTTLRDAVVWAGARAEGTHERVIVTPKGTMDASGGDEVDG